MRSRFVLVLGKAILVKYNSNRMIKFFPCLPWHSGRPQEALKLCAAGRLEVKNPQCYYTSS